MSPDAPFRILIHLVESYPTTTAWTLPFLLIALALVPFGGLR